MKKVQLLSYLLFLCFSINAQQTVGLFHTSDSAFSGYTLFGSSGQMNSFLIDNCGDKVYEWPGTYDTGGCLELLPDGKLVRTCVFDNGSPIGAGGKTGRIEAVKPDLLIEWEWEVSNDSLRLHHGIEPMSNGNVLAIIWEEFTETECIDAGRDTSILGGTGLWPELIAEYDPILDSIVWEWHAFDHLIQDYDNTKLNYGVVEEHPELFDLNYAPRGTNPDWQHVNAIAYNEELDQILLCSPFWNELWIIDHSTTSAEASGHTGGLYGKGGDLLWRWGNPEAYRKGDSTDQQLYFQHDAQWIPNGYPDAGKISVFNNGQERSPFEYSTVDFIDPVILPDSTYDWGVDSVFLPMGMDFTYTASPDTSFYSRIISSAEQLPNGNIFIDEGVKGRYFEIDSLGNIVWEYVNPIVRDSILEQEEIIPGTSNLHNSTFRARRIAENYSGILALPLSNQGPIELNPYPSTCGVGIKEETAQVIKVYPNPANDVLNLELTANYNYRISNNLGQVVSTGNYEGNAINIESLNPGLYFLTVSDRLESRLSTVKFIKN